MGRSFPCGTRDSDQRMRNLNSTEKELEIQVQIARNPETKTCNQGSTATNPESMTSWITLGGTSNNKIKMASGLINVELQN